MDKYLTATTDLALNSASLPANGSPPVPFATSCYTMVNQIRVLSWREFLLITRNPADIAGRLLVNTWVGCFLGIVFWGSGGGIVSDIRSTSSALYIEVIASQLIPFMYMSLSQVGLGLWGLEPSTYLNLNPNSYRSCTCRCLRSVHVCPSLLIEPRIA